MTMIKLILIFLTLSFSIKGIGQTKTMPVINKIVNSYLDTLIKDEEIPPNDTLLLDNDFEIESRFLKVPNIKKIKDCGLNGNYYILRIYYVDLKDKTLKLKVQCNNVKYTKLDKVGSSVESLESRIYEYYWITYDCKNDEWEIKK